MGTSQHMSMCRGMKWRMDWRWIGFSPHVSVLKILSFYRRTQEWMKTKLDQIWIPPLCRGMSEMGPTLVPCDLKVLGSNPSGVNLLDYRQDQGHHGIFFLVFLF